MKAGEEFVKMLRPVGCIICLLTCILVVVLCLTAGRDPIPGYESPHDTAYYTQHANGTEELMQELNTAVFPALDGILDCHSNDNGIVVITIDSDHFAVTRSAILRYFDESLFEFKEG